MLFGRAASRVLVRAGEGSLEDADAAWVAAAVLDEHGHAEARRHLATVGPEVWTRWAELVPEPGRGRLLGLARAPRAAA